MSTRYHWQYNRPVSEILYPSDRRRKGSNINVTDRVQLLQQMSPNIGQDPDFVRVFLAHLKARVDSHQTETHSQVIEEGPVSTTSRFMRVFNDGRDPEWVVAKKATIRRKLSKEPHDIVKESRIVSGTSHPNVGLHLAEPRDWCSLASFAWC